MSRFFGSRFQRSSLLSISLGIAIGCVGAPSFAGKPNPQPEPQARPAQQAPQAADPCAIYDRGWESGSDKSLLSPGASADEGAALLAREGLTVLRLDRDELRNPRCPAADRWFVARAGDALGEVPLPIAAGGRDLEARVRQLLRTPVAELKALMIAKRDYARERESLFERFGVDVRPAQMAPDLRFPGLAKEVMQPFAQYCSVVDGKPVNIPDGYLGFPLEVRLTEYVPGRERYDPASLFHFNDLLIAMVGNERAWMAYASRVRANSRYCQDTQARWSLIQQTQSSRADI